MMSLRRAFRGPGVAGSACSHPADPARPSSRGEPGLLVGSASSPERYLLGRPANYGRTHLRERLRNATGPVLARADVTTNRCAQSRDRNHAEASAVNDAHVTNDCARRCAVPALDASTGLTFLPRLSRRTRRPLAIVVAATVGVRVSRACVPVGRRMSDLPSQPTVEAAPQGPRAGSLRCARVVHRMEVASLTAAGASWRAHLPECLGTDHPRAVTLQILTDDPCCGIGVGRHLR